MKIFTARASGSLGGQLVPLLEAGGDDTVGTTRSAAKTDAVTP